MALSTSSDAALAAHRFGLGEPDLAVVGADARGWLKAQIGPADAQRGTALPSLAQALAVQIEARRQPGAAANSPLRALVQADLRARLVTAATTPRPFAERLALFWANHFTVSLGKGSTTGLVGAFEREAVRPHIAGRFADLLAAAVTHPAMLRYLDNHLSAGPQSRVVLRLQRRAAMAAATSVNASAGADALPPPRLTGLNENLAREVLELHTLGVSGGGSTYGGWGGYTQADVTAFARVLTGWRVPLRELLAREELPKESPTRCEEAWHEPGPKPLLGKVYPEGAQALDQVCLLYTPPSPRD